MKKSIVFITIQLLTCALVFAQTDDPGCYVAVSTSDVGCTQNQSTCDFSTGCTSSSEFYVPCTGTAWVKASVSCNGVPCQSCAVCVNIVTAGSGDPVFTCTTLNTCVDDSCCKVCTPTIQQGYYIMRVCLLPCTANDQRNCCSASCTAYGTFSTTALSCP